MTDLEFECGCVFNVWWYSDDIFNQDVFAVEDYGNEICRKHQKQLIDGHNEYLKELKEKWGPK